MMKVLVANRGEIAIRISRALQEQGIQSVIVYSEDDKDAAHVRFAKRHQVQNDHLKPLSSSSMSPKKQDDHGGEPGQEAGLMVLAPLVGRGANAYLDIEQMVGIGIQLHCVAVVPGYGLLSENAAFCLAVQESGMVFAGPDPSALELFGDKAAARAFAEKIQVPIVPGAQVGSAQDVRNFFVNTAGRQPIMLKASMGGGGKGMRMVQTEQEIDVALERAQSEARAAFGSGDMIAEVLLTGYKHIEVQIVADGQGNVVALGERECSVQRSNQKLVEVSPCPGLGQALRKALCDAAVRLASKAPGVKGLATMEFMVNLENDNWYFIECNPRLQVEHTVTEEAWGIDLVAIQIAIAVFRSPLDKLGLVGLGTKPGRFAMQLRVNAETVSADGSALPSAGHITALRLPQGPGLRVDSASEQGLLVNPNFDSLLAKMIVSGPSFDSVVVRGRRALVELAISGVKTNRTFLLAVLDHPLFNSNDSRGLTTRFVTDNASQLVAIANQMRPFDDQDLSLPAAVAAPPPPSVAQSLTAEQAARSIICPIHGEVLDVDIAVGDHVSVGQRIFVLTAFKMEHEILSDKSGRVVQVLANKGTVCQEDQVLVVVDLAHASSGTGDTLSPAATAIEEIDFDTYTRPELELLQERESYLEDSFRKEKITKRRHAKGRRSAMENVLDLVDSGSWVEYGGFAIAHQLGRRDLQDLIESTQRDGIVGGIASINSAKIAHGQSTVCGVMSYDYLVIAGTQGTRGHQKKDRLFAICRDQSLPLVIFCEGGGGRPNDFSHDGGTAGLGVPTWHSLANMRSVKIGVASGFCFAGNAALLGMCDLIVSTRDASIAMAGPVMVEHAGLGSPNAETLGAAPMQFKNGVVHVLVQDEKAAVAASQKLLGYFQGRTTGWSCADQRRLRAIVPADRKRSYQVRDVIETLADTGSVTELCAAFGQAAVTAFARIEGWPVGIVANQPKVLGGAMDADACEKLACFMELCERFGIPVLSLCDTPGFIVGEAFEKTGLVKFTSKVFNVGSKLTVPKMTIILRKSFGLGSMAMTGGGLQLDQLFVVAWPTGEAGPMGLEGAVQLGFKKELEAIEDLEQRTELFQLLVSKAYERGSVFALANNYEIDSVIDPSNSRFWIKRGLEAANHKFTGSGTIGKARL